MPQPHDDLRKAAILVDSLDPQAADALLDQMEPSQADRIRRALLSLGSVAERERELVIGQFLGGCPAAAGNREGGTAAADDSGIEIEESLAARFVTSDQEPADESPPPPQKAAPFQFLGEAEGEAIVPFLRDENPQAVAVVLAHLPPERAADVLSRLNQTQRAEVVRRIVHLDEMSPEVLRDVEQELGSRLFEQLQKARRRMAGVTAMCQILGAADASVRNDLLASLAGNHTDAAEQLLAAHRRPEPPPPTSLPERSEAKPGPPSAEAATHRGLPGEATADREVNRRVADPPPVQAHGASRVRDGRRPTNSTPRPPTLRFGDLARWSDAALRAVFAPLPVDVVALALAGAEQQLVRRVVKRLPAARAKRVAARLKRPGPIRLSDVERAQQEIARIAEQFARDGGVESPGSRERLAMTA
jgi:flagellar motor switch protein FliG